MFDEFDKTFGGVFPSPIGELHFSMKNIQLVNLAFARFRPLSGSYISQFNPDTPCKKETRVSVPYRGATFLNRAEEAGKNQSAVFPSPIGELHFSIRKNLY